jgi:hypothetical protein
MAWHVTMGEVGAIGRWLARRNAGIGWKNELALMLGRVFSDSTGKMEHIKMGAQGAC